MGLPEYTHEELAGLEGLTHAQLEELRITFDGLVSCMDLMGNKREGLPDMAHQSWHLGWNAELMVQLTLDPRTVERAEEALRLKNPDSMYLFINA